MALISITKQAHIAYARLGAVQFVVLAERESIADADLEEFIREVSLEYKHSPVEAFYTYTNKTPLSTEQRKRLAAATDAIKAVFRANVVITESKFISVGLIAMSLLSPANMGVKMKAFSSKHLSDSFDWLATFTPFDKKEADALVARMNERLVLAQRTRGLRAP